MVAKPQKAAVHPVTTKQRFMLVRDAHPDCTDDTRANWVIATATLVRPRVDFRRLRRALQKLTERHDMLRLRFEPVKRDWVALIEPPGEVQIEQVDLGNLDDAAFRAAVTGIATAPMPLVGHPLTEMVLVKGGARGDVIVSRVHHAITDGHGMIVLTEDLFKLLIGLPILAPAISHADYIARFQDPPPGRAAEIAAFWQKMHADFPVAPSIGRKAKGLEPLVHNIGKTEPRSLSFGIDPRDFARLTDRAGANNAGIATALFSGFLEGLCQIYDEDQIMFITHVSRTDPALANYAGDHTLDPVIRYRAAGAGQMDRAMKALGGDFLAALAHLPSEAARRGNAYWQDRVAAGAYPGQFSCRQPDATRRIDRSVFSEGLKTGYGEEQRLGPYTLSKLDVSVPRRSSFDLQFRIRNDPQAPGFEMGYDGISYSAGEIRALADRVCELLELEPTAVAAA